MLGRPEADDRQLRVGEINVSSLIPIPHGGGAIARRVADRLRVEALNGTMSALGQKQTCALKKFMSALPPKADMCGATRDVRFVPKADMTSPSYLVLYVLLFRDLRKRSEGVFSPLQAF